MWQMMPTDPARRFPRFPPPPMLETNGRYLALELYIIALISVERVPNAYLINMVQKRSSETQYFVQYASSLSVAMSSITDATMS